MARFMCAMYLLYACIHIRIYIRVCVYNGVHIYIKVSLMNKLVNYIEAMAYEKCIATHGRALNKLLINIEKPPERAQKVDSSHNFSI